MRAAAIARHHGVPMPALFLHGWMVTNRVWDGFVSRLDIDQAIVPHLKSGDSLEALATEAFAAADEAGVDRFDLVGHSMGGQIAQLVAARAPSRVRSLALINSVPLGGLPFPDDIAGFFRTSGENREAQSGILAQACLSIAPAEREALLADAGSVPKAHIAKGFDLFKNGVDASVLAKIIAPTWVLATDDPFLPPALLEKEIVSKIPSARLEVLHGPGHYPQLECAAATAERLQAFWRSL